VAPFEVALAAVLPCFWIYQKVGAHILSLAPVPRNPYQSWIDAYGGEEYAQAAQAAVAMCDRAAAGTTGAVRAKMAESFALASKMEWMFWDSAWRLEEWPL
jgi:thiaminase/transcriptional activator TenA